MPTAAERAAARRQAILARGADRLSKLVQNGRGEDAAAYTHDDPPLAKQSKTDAFVGDAAPEAPPTPTTIKPAMHFPPPETNTNLPDDRRRVLEEQQAFLQNIMRATAAAPDQPNPFTAGAPEDDPLQALMAQFGGGGPMPFPPLGAGADRNSAAGAGGAPDSDVLQALMSNSFANAAGGQATPPAPPKPRSRLQKALPLIHLLAIWCLLAYFIWMKEPVLFDEKFVDVIQSGQTWSPWTRWAALLKGKVRNVHTVQFFPAFIALELVLHGWRAVTGLDAVRPPTLLALALPHLPPPLPNIITNGLKYINMGHLVLDDFAALIFTLGFITWIATFIAPA